MIELIEEIPKALLNLLEEKASEEERAEDQVKFVLADVKIAIDTANLQYEGDDHETFSRLGADVHQKLGKLFLTAK